MTGPKKANVCDCGRPRKEGIRYRKCEICWEVYQRDKSKAKRERASLPAEQRITAWHKARDDRRNQKCSLDPECQNTPVHGSKPLACMEHLRIHWAQKKQALRDRRVGYFKKRHEEKMKAKPVVVKPPKPVPQPKEAIPKRRKNTGPINPKRQGFTLEKATMPTVKIGTAQLAKVPKLPRVEGWVPFFTEEWWDRMDTRMEYMVESANELGMEFIIVPKPTFIPDSGDCGSLLTSKA